MNLSTKSEDRIQDRTLVFSSISRLNRELAKEAEK